jgi:murein DD-endopeptidase MepM/ murein hydrolase activator NlpD
MKLLGPILVPVLAAYLVGATIYLIRNWTKLRKRRLAKTVIIVVMVVTSLLLGVATYFVGPLAYLPHPKAIISVPWELDKPPVLLIPMGETYKHNFYGGHPGIDFAFKKETPITAAIDGKITNLFYDKDDGWEVDISDLYYTVRYKELRIITVDSKRA